MADGSLKFDTKIDTEGFKQGTNTLKGIMQRTVAAIKKAGSSVADAFSGSGSIDSTNVKIKALVDEIDQCRDSLYYLEKQGKYFGDAEYDSAYQKLARLENELNTYKRELEGTDSQQKKATNSTKKLGKEVDKTNQKTKKYNKTLRLLKMSLLFSFAFRALNASMKAIGEGFQNLAQYSKQTNKDISALKTSLQTLKNSFGTAFAPVLTAITPALQTLINYLSQALTVMGQFFAVLLTGATTFTKAKDAQIDYAKSLGKTTKEANKALSPIDKLNVVTDSETGGSGTPDVKDMFETVNIDPRIATVANTIANSIKASLGSILDWIATTFRPTFSNIWVELQAPIEDFRGIVAGIWTDIQTLWQPFLDYISGYYVPFLQQYFTFIGEIVTGLFDTFNKIFSDIWNLVMYPILQNILTTVLPMLTEFATEFYGLMSDVFEGIKEIFDMLWSDVAAPVLAFFTKVWTDIATVMSEFWNNWGKPIFEGLREAWQNTVDLFKTLWITTLKPIWDTFMEVLDKLWTDHLKPLLANFMDFVGELVSGALEIYNKFISPIVKWFVEKFGPPISKVISGLIKFIGDFLGEIIDVVSNIIDALKGVVQFVTGVFTGDWEKAWEGIKKIFKGVWDALVGIVKTPINLIIDIINGLISGIVSGVNTVIKAINSINFSVPDWVPGIGGRSIGFNLKTLTAPKIPKLATGTVVPANYGEFLAILGDNKREAEVVSPISAMKQAFKEAMQEMGGAGTGEIHIYLEGDAKGVFKLVRTAESEHYKQTGKAVFVH